MPIRRFSEQNTHTAKSSKVARAKAVVAHVRTVQAALDSVDKTVGKVYSAFQNPKSTFTASQVKKVLVAFGKMNRTLSQYANKSYQGLKVAVSMDLPTKKIATQLEDIMALKAKLAILRAQAAASVGFVADEADEDVVELDETGYAVDDFDPAEDVVPDEPMTDETAATAGKTADEGEIVDPAGDQPTDPDLVNPTASRRAGKGRRADEEIPADDGSDTPEEVIGEEEDETQTELPNIEFEDNGMDDIVSEEILGPEDLEALSCDEGEMPEEVTQSASVQARRLASARRTQGGHTAGTAGEADLMKLLASELLS